MNGRRYTFEFGSYYFMNGDRILFMTDQVAMAYSEDAAHGIVMHKHGRPDNVAMWLKRSHQNLRDAGCDEMANEFKMVTFPSAFDVDEINRCLESSGYLGTLMEQRGLLHANVSE